MRSVWTILVWAGVSGAMALGMVIAAPGRAAPGDVVTATGANRPGIPSAAAMTGAPAAISFDAAVHPILEQYCFGCHNPQKHKGDMDLTAYPNTAKALLAPEIWGDVASRLRDGDMPPKKHPQPSQTQRALIIQWIGSNIGDVKLDCRKLATDGSISFYHGYVMSRRLSREEYGNTMRDLLGVDLRAADDIPADGSGGEGFDNDGDTLFLSPILLEKYLHAADRVLKQILPNDGEAKLTPPLKSARARLLLAYPGPGLSSRAAAQRDLAAFLCRAFRRPVDDAEIGKYMALFERGLARGDSFDASLRLAMKGALISPNFLFLVEPRPQHAGIYRLGDYQLATRMAYFLWSSMPDQTLMDLAARGKLRDQGVIRQQVKRMLADPRSRALAENFAPQWLNITALGDTVHPDSGRFPDFDPELCRAMHEEAVDFFDSIIRDDSSLMTLIDARYTFANDRLAKLYGFAPVKGSALRRVPINDPNRGGVLTMAAVLASTSYPLRTSPVLRGRWVLETILGQKVPPPPPTAGQLPPDDKASGGRTFRQQLEQHRKRPECAACHARMDPLGFGLENFDPIGRWRTNEGGAPVDARGTLTTGETFTGPAQLRQLLLERKDQFLTAFCRKMLGYALGRGLTRFDACVIEDAKKALADSNNRPSALIEQIVLSVPFQYRYAEPDKPAPAAPVKPVSAVPIKPVSVAPIKP